MTDSGLLLITMGSLLLLGFLTHLIGQITFIPRVTLLILSGFFLGPSGIDIIPDFTQEWFPVISNLALALVGFLLGHNLTRRQIMSRGKSVLYISLSVVFITAVFVFAGLSFFFENISVALLLAAISTATAPAATSDVVSEMHARNRFSRILINTVAIDDAWGVILFGIILSSLQVFRNSADFITTLPVFLFQELGMAVLIGMAVGFPMAYFTINIRQREPAVAETLGMVLLGSGIAIYMHASFIITSMVIGIIVANTVRHHERPFHLIESFEWPILIFFFILAGSSLHLESLIHAGLAGAGYIIFRIAGRIAGAWAGASLAGESSFIRNHMGLALLPQAGVAIGIAMVAVQQFPAYRDEILPVTLGATVFFELFGPLITRWTIRKSDEVPE